jgi:hypothetical protein
METEWKRGQFCPYKPGLFCQEGYCSNCSIWIDIRERDWSKEVKTETEHERD